MGGCRETLAYCGVDRGSDLARPRGSAARRTTGSTPPLLAAAGARPRLRRLHPRYGRESRQPPREPYFEKRATFYASTLHAQQLLSGEDYSLIAPSVVICILDHVRFRERDTLHSTYLLIERDHGNVLTEDLQVHFIELPKFLKHDVDELVSPADKWLHMLRFAQEYARGGEALPEKLNSEEGVAMVFDKMQRAQSDEETRIWAESREKYKRDEATRMRAAREEGLQEGREQGLHEGLEQGMQQGREQGMQQGLEQGMQQGLEQGRLEALRDRHEIARGLLHESLEVSVVARIAKLSEAEVLALRDQSLGGEQAPGA